MQGGGTCSCITHLLIGKLKATVHETEVVGVDGCRTNEWSRQMQKTGEERERVTRSEDCSKGGKKEDD